jgi:hypothetical protein
MRELDPTKTFVVRCIDKRFSRRENCPRFILPEAYDQSIAGGSMGFVEIPAFRETVLTTIRMLRAGGNGQEPVGLEHMVFADHYDRHGQHGCKAYKIAGIEDSWEKHEEYLRRAAEEFEAQADLADMSIMLLLQDIDHAEVNEIAVPVSERRLARAR